MTQLQQRPGPFDRFRLQALQEQQAVPVSPGAQNLGFAQQPVQGPVQPGPFDRFRQQAMQQFTTVQQPAPRGPMGPQAPAGTLPNQGANPPMALGPHGSPVQRPAQAPQWPQEGPQMGSPGQTAYLPMSTPPMALATNHAAEPSRIWGTGGQPVQPSPPQSFPDGQIGPAGTLTQRVPPFQAFATNVQKSISPLIPSLGARVGEYQQRLDLQTEGTGAAGFLGNVIGSIAPSAAAAFFPPAVAPLLAAYAGSSAEQKLKETGSPASAIGAGALEAGTELIGLEAIGRLGVKNVGKLWKMVVSGDTSSAVKLAVDAGVLGTAEGGEEVLNIIGTNGLDAMLGLQTWEQAGQNIQRDAPEAFATGAAGGLLLAGAAMSSPVSPSAPSQGTPRSSAEVPAPQTTTPALSTAPQPAPIPPTTVAETLTPQATPPVEVQPAPETPSPVSEPAVPPQAAAVENQSRPSQAPPAESIAEAGAGKETIPGTQAVAQRIENAADNWYETIHSITGASREDAMKILDLYKKNKLVKLDVGIGRYQVKHGSAMDPEVLLAMLREVKKPVEQVKVAPVAGKGKVWFHGSHTDFDVITPSGNKPAGKRSRGWDGLGVWLSSGERQARMYGPKVSQWTAEPKNVLELVGGGTRPWDLLAYPDILTDFVSGDELDAIQNHWPQRKAILDRLDNVYPGGIKDGSTALNDLGQTYPEAIADKLRKQGYDAVVWRKSKLDLPTDSTDSHDVMLLLDPTLAKKQPVEQAQVAAVAGKAGEDVATVAREWDTATEASRKEIISRLGWGESMASYKFEDLPGALQSQVSKGMVVESPDPDTLSYADLRARAKELELSPVGSLAVLRERVKGASRTEQIPSQASTRKSPDSLVPSPLASETSRPPSTPSEIPKFATYEEAQEWIRKRHSDFPSAQAYQATPEYKQLYPQIAKLYEDERAAKDSTIAESMARAKIKYRDRVQFDYVTPWGVQQYTGTVVRRKNRPHVEFDAGQSTTSGQTSVRWHRGWTKLARAAQAQSSSSSSQTSERRAIASASAHEAETGRTQIEQTDIPAASETSGVLRTATTPTERMDETIEARGEPLAETTAKSAVPSEPPGKGRRELRIERVPAIFPRGKPPATNSPADFILKLAREDADFKANPKMTFKDGRLIVRDGATYRFEPDAFGVDPNTPDGTTFTIDLAQMREHAKENHSAVQNRKRELNALDPMPLRDAYFDAFGKRPKDNTKPAIVDALLKHEFGKPVPASREGGAPDATPPAESKPPAPDAAKESTVDRLEREAKGGSGSMSALGSPDKPLPSPAAIKGTRVQPSPLTGEVKQIKDIILDLESGVGHVRAGKSSKGSIGTYYPGSSKTVIRFANDLDTTAHETAHRLDDLYGIVADWATPRGVSKSGANLPQKSPFDAELRKDIFQQTIRKNYSVVKKRAEGVAEWIRAWVVNPDMAKSEAPNFTKWFEQKVPQNVRDRLRSFGDDIRRFAGAPGSEQTTANVNLGVDSKSVLDRVKEWFEADGVGGTVGDRLSAAAIDSLAPVWKGVELARTLRGLSELRPRLDPKINIRLFAGFDRKAMDVLEHGPIRANGERVADIGGIDWLMEPIKAGKPEQVEQNFKDVVAWGLSERIVERAELLNNAVNRAEELEDRIAEAKAAIRKAQEAGDGESMGSLVDQLKSDIKELSRVKKQVGFAGPTTKMRSWVEARKQRLSGMGGGVMSDIGVAQETLREIASDPARQARAEEGARRYRLWSDAVLRYMLDKGRISQAQFDAIQENNNRYFAMKREYERINDEFIKHGGRKLGTVSKVIQRFKGSTRTIENPYVSLLEQTYAFMREADRNAALRTFTDLLTKERSMYQGKAIDFDQIGSRAKAGDQDAITVFEDGREVKWQFAPEIHRSLKDFGKTPDQSIVSKILAAPASLLRTMVVMSPDFMVRNQIRDPVARSIVSETGSKPWSQFYYLTPDGMAEFNADLSRFRRMGAGLFGHNLISRDDYYRRFKEAFDKVSGKRNVIITVPSKLVEGYRNFAEFGETIGRMAEFHRAEKKGREQLGYGPEDAAMYAAAQARDIQDFAIAGHAAREVNRYVPFFNAAIRGVMKSVQSAKTNPAGFAARWMLYAAMPEVMFYLWNTLVGDDEEEFDQLPTYQRDFFWNMKIGPDLWLAIPKPWELGVMASGIGRAIDAARGKENAFDDYYKSLGSSTSPIGHEGLVGPWRGLIEVMANYDFFRNRPIVSPWEKDLDLGLREGDDHASRVGQLIQKAFGIDARNADHLIRSYLGGYGRAGLTASDIGREDKPTALRTTGQQLSGVLKSSPAAFGKDAEWVSEYARRKGETNKKWYREFRTLIDAYYDADNSSERDEAAKRIREESSSLRASRPKD